MLDDAINKLRVGKRRKRRELSSKKIEGKDEKRQRVAAGIWGRLWKRT